jgi:TonB family protein
MPRDIVISAIFHVLAIAALWASGQFINGHKINPEDVMRVSLVSLPELAASQPISPAVVQQAVAAAEPPISMPDAKSKPIAIKPKAKPKEKQKSKRDMTAKQEAEQTAAAEAQAEIGQAAGSPFAGATVDNAEFANYPYWFTQAWNKIRLNFQIPVDVDGLIVCTIYFQVLKSGRVAEVRIEKSSGVPAFDRACLSTIERSSPFPPFPKEFSAEIVGFTVPLTNKL